MSMQALHCIALRCIALHSAHIVVLYALLSAVYLLVVRAIENASQASNAYAAKLHHSSMSQVHNVWCNPATIVQLPQVVHGLMIASDYTNTPDTGL